MKFFSTHRPLVLAHRGDTSSAPENSAEAVRSAKAMGCDGVEIDVRMTLDGHLVVAHDPVVEGMAIAEVSLREALRGGGLDVLEEILAVAEGMLVDLEIKGPVEDPMPIVNKLKALADTFPAIDYMVSSFWVSILEQTRVVMPKVPCGILTSAAFDQDGSLALETATEKGFDLILPSASSVTERLIEKASSSGIEVIAWTENDIDRFRELRDLGISGVITDKPLDMLAAK